MAAKKKEKQKSGFEMHGLGHSSPSSINLWANAPDVFIANKLMGVNWDANPAMWRGIEAESAVVNVISHDWSFEKATKQALKGFEKKTCLWPDREKVDKEAKAMVGCIEQAIEVLLEYGKPSFDENDQHRIEILCKGDGWELPIIGYLDLYYPDQNLIIDLKTTLKCPTKMSPEHNRQAAVYSKAMGDIDVAFLYVTPKKSALLRPDNVDETLAEIKTLLNRQERFLRLSDDPQFLADIIPVNKGSFYWGSEQAQKCCKKLYGV